ncbi:glycosyltransferase [Heyndrickxia sp. FSL W8-0496]|uniref:glycosyltransferase n=1 Tax=Heyndrickxia TaxID=2837504 RepID=UPI0030F4E88C
MSKTKIALVVPSLVIGGAENVVFQLSKALHRETDIDLIVICLSSRKNTMFEHELSNQGIQVIYLNNKGKLSIITLFLLWKYLNKFKPKIVHTHLHSSLYVFPWIFFHNSLLLHTIHSTPRFEFSSRIIRLMKILYKRRVAIPIAISEKIKLEAAKLYKLPLDNIEYVKNPVNLEKFKKKDIAVSHQPLVKFIHVARLDPQKNQRLLLEAFAILCKNGTHATLTIVGDGDLREQLEALASSLKIQDRVYFIGSINDVEHYLNCSDIFVLSSINEGLPLSILEAMAMGLPIISTNVGGIGDVVQENGILVESENTKALSNAMMKLAKDKDLRLKMSEASFRLVKQFDISIIAHEYKKLYLKYS